MFSTLAFSVIAAASIGAPAQTASKSRLDEIWGHADSRIVRQQDEWFENGDFPRAMALLDLQIQYKPNDEDIVTNVGWMLMNVKRYDDAIALYKSYMIKHPSNTGVPVMLAQHYVNKKQYPLAIAELERAVKDGAGINAYRLLAKTYERQKDLKNSLRVYKALNTKWPKDPVGQMNLKRVTNLIKSSGGR
jgi:predicted Zn-dependent protease